MDLNQAYNYDVFVQEKFARWMRFDASPPLGLPAPDFCLTGLDGQVIHLSKLWPKAAWTIFEFGSLT